MYAARPDLQGTVDGVGLHPYGATAEEVFARVCHPPPPPPPPPTLPPPPPPPPPDVDADGAPDDGERFTDPANRDADGDRLPDGLEQAATIPVPPPAPGLKGTNPKRFIPDLDPKTRTSAVKRDTDRDGRTDRQEDRNRNDRRDRGESDPRRRN